MINPNTLTEKELIDQYWHSDDPVIARLCEILDRFHQMTKYLPREVEYSDELGWTVNDEELGHYIDGLKSDRDYYETQMLEAQEEVERLSARSVAELLGEMRATLQDQDKEIRKLNWKLNDSQKREQEATEKLNVWGILTSECPKLRLTQPSNHAILCL